MIDKQSCNCGYLIEENVFESLTEFCKTVILNDFRTIYRRKTEFGCLSFAGKCGHDPQSGDIQLVIFDHHLVCVVLKSSFLILVKILQIK